jgi:mono/diheme cytochrome c family protein
VQRDAVVSGLEDAELAFLQSLLADPQWATSQPGRPALLQALAGAVVREAVPEKVAALQALASAQPADSWRARAIVAGIGPGAAVGAAEPAVARILTPAETARMTAGAAVYTQICAACHGTTGQGVVPSAPPLASSEWATGSENRLIRLVLQGIAGPISVNGTTYQPPTILPEMPGLAGGLDDDQIASVLTYIRNSWGHNAAPITPAQVAAVRNETRQLSRPWTPASLLEIR